MNTLNQEFMLVSSRLRTILTELEAAARTGRIAPASLARMFVEVETALDSLDSLMNKKGTP